MTTVPSLSGVDGLEPPVGPQQDDFLNRRRLRRRMRRLTGALVLILLASMVACAGFGPTDIAFGTVAQILGHHLFEFPSKVTWSQVDDVIVWQIRAPRVLLGVAVGAGLSVCGTALQAMVRNILADPYLLGVSAGASTGAAATILFGVGALEGSTSLTGSAFVGALLAMVLVFALARVGGRVTSTRLLLAGVAVGYALSAATSFLIFIANSPQGTQDVVFWILGSLSLAVWSSALPATGIVAVAIAVLLMWSRRLDALAIGDDTAHALGISPTRVRAELLVVVSLCTGAVVAVSGGIGFVGLVIPHLARRCVGGVHSRVLPIAALIGAIFVIWADALARVVLAPADLPLGIVTAVFGAPLLFILIRQFHPAAS